MKHTSFSNKQKSLPTLTSASKSESSVRTARIAAASAFLESTREEFSMKVVKAKSRWQTVEAGVLAGPVLRHR